MNLTRGPPAARRSRGRRRAATAPGTDRVAPMGRAEPQLRGRRAAAGDHLAGGRAARLWRRPLGDGFSSIVTDGTTLYTLYRDGADDVAIAMEAATGKTAWETSYAAPFNETCSQQLGPARARRRSSPVTG